MTFNMGSKHWFWTSLYGGGSLLQTLGILAVYLCKWYRHEHVHIKQALSWCFRYVCICIRGQDLAYAVHLKFWLSHDCRFVLEKSWDHCMWKHPRLALKGGVDSLKHVDVVLSFIFLCSKYICCFFVLFFQNRCLHLRRTKACLRSYCLIISWLDRF